MGVYRLELFALPFVFPTLTVNNASSSKGLRLNEKSYTLWHKCLGHISKHRMVRLIKGEILPDLDFSDFDTCVDFIKGKLTLRLGMPMLTNTPSCLGLFIQIFVAHSPLLL